MATQEGSGFSSSKIVSQNNYLNNTNLFAQVSQRIGLLPGGKGLNDISAMADESTQTPLSNSSPLEQVRREAETLAQDVVLNFKNPDPKKPPNKYCKTLRRTVQELSDRHDLVFKGMVNRLKLEENDAFPTFVIVADEIFDDGQINWGRIVAVYTFAARLARFYTDSNTCSKDKMYPEKIALFVGKYVANKLGQWIVDNGGWEAFAEYFPDHGEFEEKMWKGLLFTAVGLGALATMVAAR